MDPFALKKHIVDEFERIGRLEIMVIVVLRKVKLPYIHALTKLGSTTNPMTKPIEMQAAVVKLLGGLNYAFAISRIQLSLYVFAVFLQLLACLHSNLHIALFWFLVKFWI